MGGNQLSNADAYMTQKIMTSPPEELTTLLYDGALRFIKKGIVAIDEKNMLEAHQRIIRAQDIVIELMETLNMSQEISSQLMALYDFVLYCLVEGNVKKDKTHLNHAQELLQDMRDTWVEAIKQSRIQKTSPAPVNA
ncbi:flagellar protein flis [Heliomicrobium modesticaldum Ice1]|uniref:Flagellar secretion chaperone FliS n=2 Tax=Heliomicrobium modesticaldum TaxID=35701 RepID=B0TH36_HELMI|nr:flagellar protein flis [Heliomicrobium modesticaldum Ice1]